MNGAQPASLLQPVEEGSTVVVYFKDYVVRAETGGHLVMEVKDGVENNAAVD